MAALTCPRCDAALVAEPAAEGEIDVHRCSTCHGLWVDGADVGWVYPALARHRTRVTELLACGARRDMGIGRCPRGHDETLEFPFFDLWLDLCESCGGLWLDGDEARFVARTAKQEDGLFGNSPGGSVYRGGERASDQRVRCHECGKDVHPRRTYLSADGPICEACAEIDELADELADTRPASRLRRAPLQLLRLFGRLLDADGKRLRRGGFSNWGW